MYCVLQLHWKPGEFADLLPRKQAVMIAYILKEVENEKKVRTEAKSIK